MREKYVSVHISFFTSEAGFTNHTSSTSLIHGSTYNHGKKEDFFQRFHQCLTEHFFNSFQNESLHIIGFTFKTYHLYVYLIPHVRRIISLMQNLLIRGYQQPEPLLNVYIKTPEPRKSKGVYVELCFHRRYCNARRCFWKTRENEISSARVWTHLRALARAQGDIRNDMRRSLCRDSFFHGSW